MLKSAEAACPLVSGSGRGTFTYQEWTAHQVAHGHHTQFIDVAAGKRHSLLVSNEGLVFSTGEGRADQLGAHTLGLLPIRIRRFPKAALPSGELKRGTDLKLVQAQVREVLRIHLAPSSNRG